MARAPKTPRPPIDMVVEGMEWTGEARGTQGTRRVLAWGGLPGERVMVRVRKRHRGVLTGTVESVLEASADRVAPLEAHYLCCSPWQILATERENSLKGELVRRRFAEAYGIQLPEFEVQGEVEVGYRNKLEFGFTQTDAGASLSFFERGGPGWRRAVGGCVLGTAAINAAARSVVARLHELGVSGRSLKSLMLRGNRQGEVVAGLYTTESIPSLEGLPECEALVGLKVYYSDPRSPASRVDDTWEVWGTGDIEETLEGRAFRVDDRSFFQVNVPRFEQALAAIREAIPQRSRLFDLYAGVGSIGIGVGRPGTVFVESDPDCVAGLRENVVRAGLVDAQIVAGTAEASLPEIGADATVVVDPPRVGLHPKVVAHLAAERPGRLIYLSCNPDSQGRDLAAWGERFRLVDFRAFNFFPRTPHLETLAVLEAV